MDSEDHSDLQFEETLLKLMSFVSIALNKNVSPVAFFILLLKQDDLRVLCCNTLDMSFYTLVNKMTFLYPILHKSRKISNYIKRHNIQMNSNDP